jgi:hypothetical protein
MTTSTTHRRKKRVMATVSITIPDNLIPRVTAAMRAGFPQYSALTDIQCFKAVTADYWRLILTRYESTQAEAGLRADLATTQAQTAADAGGIG